jgi:hypothetical protein
MFLLAFSYLLLCEFKFNENDGNQSNNLKSIENLLEQPGEFELKNHLTIKCNNLNLLLEANTCKDNMTSLFTKQIKLPKGTIIKDLKYKLDQPNHNLYLEAPIQI